MKSLSKAKKSGKKKMKIDFNRPMTNPYGLPIEQDGQPLLLGHVCINALTAPIQGDKRSEGEKIACWKLSRKLIAINGPEYDFQVLELKAKEIVMLEELICKLYQGATIYPQAKEMLEPEENDETKEGKTDVS